MASRPSIGVLCLGLIVLGCEGRSARVVGSGPSHDGMEIAGAVVKPSDSAFHAMQARGVMAMGVDQETSTHHFTPLPDGGRIQLERDIDDSAGVAEIRRHLGQIAVAFKSGDFSTPMFVHMRMVPGTDVMVEKRALITYTESALPRGGALRMTTRDPDAIRAIHEFLAFQRSDHRASE